MKKCSKITAAVISVILMFSAFVVPTFAAEELPVEIKNDSFFVKIPAGYEMTLSPFYDFIRVDRESEMQDERIAVIVLKNKYNVDINTLTEQKYSDFANSVLNEVNDELQIVENSAEAKYAEVNKSAALCCRVRTSELSRYAYCYIFTAVNNIYCLYFNTDTDVYRDEVLSTLNSFCLNDERFPDDAEAAAGDFSDALPYEEALIKDYARYGYSYAFSPEYEDVIPQNFAFAVLGFYVIPFIIVTAITVVLIVKYVKRKKKLKGFTFGF